MKIGKKRLEKIILEELNALRENKERGEEEKALAQMLYVLLTKARKEFEEYLGKMGEGEDPSSECQALYDSVADMWKMADDMLTGGETSEALPELFGDKINEVEEPRSSSQITSNAVSQAQEIQTIISELLPNLQRLKDRERYSDVDLTSVTPTRPGRAVTIPAGSRTEPVKSKGMTWVDEDKVK